MRAKMVRPTVRLTPAQNTWVQAECERRGITFQDYIVSMLMEQGMPDKIQQVAEGQMTLFDVMDADMARKEQNEQ